MEVDMDVTFWVLLAIIVVVAVAALFWAARKRRTENLKDTFGPEYDRTLDKTGSRRETEAELRSREQHHDELDLRPLDPAARRRYQEEWLQVQALFVDDPRTAAKAADSLIVRVMRERGYPAESFESRAAELSVERPGVVDKYRAAHETLESHQRGESGTELIRRAMLLFRELFSQLVGEGATHTEDGTSTIDLRQDHRTIR